MVSAITRLYHLIYFPLCLSAPLLFPQACQADILVCHNRFSSVGMSLSHSWGLTHMLCVSGYSQVSIGFWAWCKNVCVQVFVCVCGWAVGLTVLVELICVLNVFDQSFS